MLGCAISTAYNRVDKSLRSTLKEASDELRTLELSRLDELWWSVYPEALRGRYGAIDRCLRIMERRAHLLGIDAPQKMVVDWREEAKARGLDDDEVFEQFVEMLMVGHARTLGEQGSGEATDG